MLAEAMELIKSSYSNFAGNGMMLALFLAALLYLFLKKDELGQRDAFGFYSIGVFILIFNPWTAYAIAKMLGDSTFWRVFWLLPISIVVAYVGVKLIISRKTQKAAALTLCALTAIIILCGNLMYTRENFQRPQNLYKIPQAAIGVSDTLLQLDDEPKAAFPDELVCYIRQYDASIHMTYGRQAMRGLRISDDSTYNKYARRVYRAFYNPEEYAERLVKSLEKTNTEYIVLSPDTPLYGYMGSLPFSLVGEYEEFQIFRLETS